MRSYKWNFPVWSGFWKLGCTAYICGVVSSAVADDAGTGTPSGTTQTAPAIQFTVIESKTVQQGSHTVTYNRVAPPAITVAASASTTNAATAPLDQLQAQQQQQLVTVMVSATVFSHQISQLSWSMNGATYQGYSNIDFTVLANDTQFSVGNTTYNLIINVVAQGTSPNATGPVAVPSIPELPPLTANESAYVVVTTDGNSIPDAAVAPIDGLHDYFDANRAAILAAATQRQVDAAAQAQWAKDHPQAPKNTVINFWKVPATNSVGSPNTP